MRSGWCVVLGLTACAGVVGASPDGDAAVEVPTGTRAVLDEPKAARPDTRVLEASQTHGTVVWVLPGPRLVDEAVFGTARAPQRTGRVDKRQPEPLRELATEFPWILGLPMKDRGWPRQGQPWVTRAAIPFSDVVATVDGSLTATLIDRVQGDGGGPPDATYDEAKVQAKFTDPAGRRYEVRWRKVVHPPLPGWETGGGVALDQRLYGATGNGTPLLPAAEVPGATWALVDVVVQGKVVARGQLAELAVTQATRDRSGRLGTLSTMPLAPQETLTGHPTQAHLVVWPVQLVDDLPTYAPLPIPWLGQDGQPQPWIVVVWGDVTVKEGELPPPPAPRRKATKPPPRQP